MANSNMRNEADSFLVDASANEPPEQRQGNQSSSQAGPAPTSLTTNTKPQDSHQSPFHDDGGVSSIESYGGGKSNTVQANASAPGKDASTTHGSQPNKSTTHLAPPIAPAAGIGASTPSLSPSTQPPLPKPTQKTDNGYDPATKSKPHQSCWKVLMGWKAELAAALVAILLLVCEIVILAHYDGKFLLLHWSHGWKINAVFAFITTFIEAALAFYVGAAIGQLRWHWYKKKEHRLVWLDIMTNARQPSGAMRLLFRRGSQR